MWPVVGNSDKWELTEGTDIYIGGLHIVELIAEFSKFLGYKNHRNETWAVYEDSDCSTDWTKDVSNENVTVKTETREEIFDPVSERFFFQIVYYCLYIILFVPI